MKILLTHRYFLPDTAPYAVLLGSMASHLSNAKHDVSVFSSVTSYRDVKPIEPLSELNGVKAHRVWVFQENKKNMSLRVLNAVIYCIALFFHILKQRPDLVTASSVPPVFAAWFASLAAKICGAKFIYHMQDIHPEVSLYSGGLMGRGMCRKILTWFDNQSLRRSTAVVVLSEDMKNTIIARNLRDLPIHVINNFMPEENNASDVLPASSLKKPETIRVVFAGNLGRFQKLPLLTEGIATCFNDWPQLELLFLGDGVARDELFRVWGKHPQIKFSPYLPFRQARQIIKDADVGIVSLDNDIYKVAYPSKMFTYLGLGVPILALVEPESNLARNVAADKLGEVPTELTPKEIGKSLSRLLKGEDVREHVLKWYDKNAAREVTMEKWDKLLMKINPNS